MLCQAFQCVYVLYIVEDIIKAPVLNNSPKGRIYQYIISPIYKCEGAIVLLLKVLTISTQLRTVKLINPTIQFLMLSAYNKAFVNVSPST